MYIKCHVDGEAKIFEKKYETWIVIYVYFIFFFSINYIYMTRSHNIALYAALNAYKRITHGQTIRR